METPPVAPDGTISITLGDKTFVMKPSIRALMGIELAADLGIAKIIQLMGTGDVRYVHVIHIIHQGILAGPDKFNCPPIEEIGKWLVGGGMAYASTVITPFLVEALKASPKEK